MRRSAKVFSDVLYNIWTIIYSIEKRLHILIAMRQICLQNCVIKLALLVRQLSNIIGELRCQDEQVNCLPMYFIEGSFV